MVAHALVCAKDDDFHDAGLCELNNGDNGSGLLTRDQNLALFEIEMKVLLWDTIETAYMPLCLTLEVLDSIDMITLISEGF